MKRALAVVALALSSACGGSSPSTGSPPPTTPPTPTPTPVLAYLDGVTEAALTPDSVVPQTARIGDSLTVEKAGYVKREQKWNGLPVALWPDHGKGPNDYRQLVYGGDANEPLRRWAQVNLTVVLEAGQSPEDAARIKEAFSGVFADVAAAGGPVFAWADTFYGNVQVIVNPSNTCLTEHPGWVACARWSYDSTNAITKADMIFSTVSWAVDERAMRFTMGYVLGLHDCSVSDAAMNWSRSYDELERDAIHMMYKHRDAGNVYPDRDPGFAATSGRGGTGLGGR